METKWRDAQEFWTEREYLFTMQVNEVIYVSVEH